MKIKFLATYSSPDSYKFIGERIEFTTSGVTDYIDFSEFNNTDVFEGIEDDNGNPLLFIRDVKRAEGDLKIIMCQSCKLGGGNWAESQLMDSGDYDKNITYIKKV